MLNRRDFISSAAALPTLMMTGAVQASTASPEIAFTFDDPKTQHGANLRWQEVNERILGALRRHRIRSILFVCGMRIDNDSGRDLIAEWDRNGHLIGNHSYSHLSFNRESLADFEADALRNEPLVVPYKNFTRLFRYPFFKEGSTPEKRD